jgi:hypothetical protein
MRLISLTNDASTNAERERVEQERDRETKWEEGGCKIPVCSFTAFIYELVSIS